LDLAEDLASVVPVAVSLAIAIALQRLAKEYQSCLESLSASLKPGNLQRSHPRRNQ